MTDSEQAVVPKVALAMVALAMIALAMAVVALAIFTYRLAGGADRKLNLLEFLEQKLNHLPPSRLRRVAHTSSVNKQEPPYGYGPWQDFNSGLASFRQSLNTRTASAAYQPIRHSEWELGPTNESAVEGPLGMIVLLSVNKVARDLNFEMMYFGRGDLATLTYSDWYIVPRSRSAQSTPGVVTGCLEVRGTWQFPMLPTTPLEIGQPCLLKALEDRESEVRPALHQIYGDMLAAGARFGVLTTYNLADLLLEEE